MAWFKRESGELDTSGEKRVKTEGLWVKCDGCRQIIWKKDLEENMNVCPKCDKHFRIDARTRLALLLDDNQYETFDGDIAATNTASGPRISADPSKPGHHRKSRTGCRRAIAPDGSGHRSGSACRTSDTRSDFLPDLSSR